MEDPITIKFVPFDHPDAVRMRDEQQQEIWDVKPAAHGAGTTAANVPIFLVAYRGDIAVGCGGLRPLQDEGLPQSAEIKRMYAARTLRSYVKRDAGEAVSGPSVAVVILKALEQAALERGWPLMKLSTSVAMVQARKFYEKHGYVLCEGYGHYFESETVVCYEKQLG